MKGYDVSVKDEELVTVTMEDLKDTSVLLLSATTSTIDRAYQLARDFKLQYGRPVIMGGIHVTALPEEAIANGADIAITGEAELTLPAVMQDLNRILSLPPHERIIQGQLVKDLDALPYADFNLVEQFSKHISLKNINLTVVPVMPVRGCTNRCKFCASWKIGGLRSRSTENVLRELDALLEAGYTFFYFCSDYFSANKRKSRELLEGMKRIRFKEREKWSMIQDSVHMAFNAEGEVDHEYLDLLQEAGIIQIGLGIESLQEACFSDLVGTTGKKQQSSQSLEALRVIKEHGMAPYAFLMAGAENQTAEEIIDNVKKAKKYGKGQIPILTPFPGTELYTEMKELGKIIIDGPGYWKYFDAMNVVFRHDTLSAQDLREATIKAWKTFYSYKEASFYFLKALGHIMLFRPKTFIDDINTMILNLAQLRVIEVVNRLQYKE
jgi:radical SAM superfamily enzyme YgiQ (UPF0313 family)